MPAIFLTGPMAWPPLLDAVAGGEAYGPLRPATLDGAAVERDAGAAPLPLPMPRLMAVEGAQCTGVLIDDPGQGLFDRLEYCAGAMGMVPVPRHVSVGDVPSAALAFMAGDEAADEAADTPTGPWDAAGWQAVWGAAMLHAAAEIMGYFSRLPVAELGWRMPMILSRAWGREVAGATPAPAQIRSGTAAAKVSETSRQATHEGYFLTRSYELRHPRFDGGQSETLRREVFVAADAVIVLPYDPVRDRLLLVEQFRMGPYGRGDPRPWVLEPVAGRIDAGETPEMAVLRETREEAGLDLRRLEHMTSHYCSPGCSTEFYHCYLGLADLPDASTGHGGLAAEHEDIRTHVLDFDDAMALVESGEANIGPLVLMLLWLQRERPRLRKGAEHA